MTKSKFSKRVARRRSNRQPPARPITLSTNYSQPGQSSLKQLFTAVQLMQDAAHSTDGSQESYEAKMGQAGDAFKRYFDARASKRRPADWHRWQVITAELEIARQTMPDKIQTLSLQAIEHGIAVDDPALRDLTRARISLYLAVLPLCPATPDQNTDPENINIPSVRGAGMLLHLSGGVDAMRDAIISLPPSLHRAVDLIFDGIGEW